MHNFCFIIPILLCVVDWSSNEKKWKKPVQHKAAKVH